MWGRNGECEEGLKSGAERNFTNRYLGKTGKVGTYRLHKPVLRYPTTSTET